MSTSGYSATPLWKKLGIKPGSRIALVRAPAGFAESLQPALGEASLLSRPAAPIDMAVLFVKSLAELQSGFSDLEKLLGPAGMLWVSWPKKSSGVATDLEFDTVQRTGLATGLVDTKICAIDATWSGLKFVRRIADRPKAGKPARR